MRTASSADTPTFTYVEWMRWKHAALAATRAAGPSSSDGLGGWFKEHRRKEGVKRIGEDYGEDTTGKRRALRSADDWFPWGRQLGGGCGFHPMSLRAATVGRKHHPEPGAVGRRHAGENQGQRLPRRLDGDDSAARRPTSKWCPRRIPDHARPHRAGKWSSPTKAAHPPGADRQGHPPAPTVTSIELAHGPAAGGIRDDQGQGFVTGVDSPHDRRLGGSARVVVDSAEEITAKTTATAAGADEVAVTDEAANRTAGPRDPTRRALAATRGPTR